MEKVLDSIKQMLGIRIDDNNFDNELLIHINSALSEIQQFGLGFSAFEITNNTVWISITNGDTNLNLIKNYIYDRVRLTFDPPQNSFLVKAIEDRIVEYAWRINNAIFMKGD